MNVSHALPSLPVHVRSQALRSFLGSPFDFNHVFGVADSSQFADADNTPIDLLNSFIQRKGSNPVVQLPGRNMSLSDPESAYRMMTLINNKDSLYKAQYSELSQMGTAISRMKETGKNLSDLAATACNSDIKNGLQGFVKQYNEWILRFDPDMQGDGLLAGTQAAQISRYEMEQSVKNIFNGAKDGVRGMGALGVSVDPFSGSLSLDSAKLDSMLASGRQGVICTIQEFGTNFAKSTGLLIAENNFIPNQLDNLKRVIHYISDNVGSLQAEFGTGDAANPTGQVARALALYKQSYGI